MVSQILAPLFPDTNAPGTPVEGPVGPQGPAGPPGSTGPAGPSGSGGGGNVFIYRDSEPSPSGNIFATWAGAYAAAFATDQPATIFIDQSIHSCSIPAAAGDFDLHLITLAAFDANGSTLTVNDGVTWNEGVRKIGDGLTVITQFASPTTALITPNLDVNLVLDNANLFIGNTGRFIDAEVNDIEATLYIGDESQVRGNGVDGYIMWANGNGGHLAIVITAKENANVGNDTVGGSSGARLSITVENLSNSNTFPGSDRNNPAIWPFYTGQTPTYNYLQASQNTVPYVDNATVNVSTSPFIQTGTLRYDNGSNQPFWWTGTAWTNGAFQPEYVQMTLTTPQTTGLASGSPLIFNSIVQNQNNNHGGFSSASDTNFFISYQAAGPNLAFKLTGNIGSLFDGNIAYQWWDVTNNVGVGNVSGNVGGGTPGDVVAIIPANYGNSQSIAIFFSLRLVFVGGTTFIGENSAGGFILPWMTMESIGTPQ